MIIVQYTPKPYSNYIRPVYQLHEVPYQSFPRMLEGLSSTLNPKLSISQAILHGDDLSIFDRMLPTS